MHSKSYFGGNAIIVSSAKIKKGKTIKVYPKNKEMI